MLCHPTKTLIRFKTSEAGQARPSVQVASQQIERALEEHSVVVVPGFFGTKEGGVIASLGRGGSDLSAVLLADELGLSRTMVTH